MEMMVLVMMLFSLIVSCLVLFSSIVTVLISPSLSLRIFSPMCLLSFCCQFVSVRSSCSVCVLVLSSLRFIRFVLVFVLFFLGSLFFLLPASFSLKLALCSTICLPGVCISDSFFFATT